MVCSGLPPAVCLNPLDYKHKWSYWTWLYAIIQAGWIAQLGQGQGAGHFEDAGHPTVICMVSEYLPKVIKFSKMESLLWYVIPPFLIKTSIEVSILSLRPDPNQDRRHNVHNSCWNWLKSSSWAEVSCWKKPYSYSAQFKLCGHFWRWHLEKKVDSPGIHHLRNIRHLQNVLTQQHKKGFQCLFQQGKLTVIPNSWAHVPIVCPKFSVRTSGSACEEYLMPRKWNHRHLDRAVRSEVKKLEVVMPNLVLQEATVVYVWPPGFSLQRTEQSQLFFVSVKECSHQRKRRSLSPFFL